MPELKRGTVARIGGWAASHRRPVIVAWVLAVVVAMGASHAAGTHYVNNLALPGTDSQRATDLLAKHFPAQAGDTDQIVLFARQGLITDTANQAAVAPMLARVAVLPHVTGVISPFAPGAGRQISADRRTAFATVAFDERPDLLPTTAVNRVTFVLSDQRIVKLFGLGLASAVFLDAFVVRSLLLPSVLTLLGRRTWSLPRGIERRLPAIAIDPPEPQPEAG